MVKFSPVPDEVKPLTHLLDLAEEHEDNKIVVSYWARASACLLALRLVPEKRSKETSELLNNLLDWLDQTKADNPGNKAITNRNTGRAFIEEYALQLFDYGVRHDTAQIFNKNTIKIFYTAGLLIDILEQFGSLPDSINQKRKYAKWKADYIHSCLIVGELPLPGPPSAVNDDGSCTLSKEQLATYTKHVGPIPLGNAELENSFSNVPFFPNTPSEKDFSLSIQLNTESASSAITHVVPQQLVPLSPPTISHNTAPQLATTSLSASTDNKQVYLAQQQIKKAQMYCEFATSALKYGEIFSALENLRKVLKCLEIRNDILSNKM